MKIERKTLVIAISIIFLNISCDQITKEYARQNYKGQGTLQIVGNVFIIHYAENEGAFLSMGSDLAEPFKTIILTVIPAVLLLIFSFFLLHYKKQLTMLHLVCISTIIGGGISNIFDRIIYGGYVTDFMNFGIGTLRTGILNFADISITFGAIFLVVSYYINKKII